MKKLLAFFLIVCSIKPSAAYDSVLLDKGAVTPFQGVLFSNSDANKIRVELIEKDTLLFLNESYKRSLDLTDKNMKLKDEQLDIVMNQNFKLTKALNSQKDMNNWERALWFGLGIAVSTLTLYGLNKATK